MRTIDVYDKTEKQSNEDLERGERVQRFAGRAMRRSLAGLALALVAAAGGPASAVGATSQGGRSYELASPAEKNGGGILPNSMRTRAAADGEAVMFASLAAFGDAIGTGVATEYMSLRGASGASGGSRGWSTHAITPAGESMTLGANLTAESMYVGEFSENLSSGVFQSWTPLTADPLVALATNLYRRTDLRAPGSGTYDLVTACPGCAEPLEVFMRTFRPGFGGASDDFGHIAFDSGLRLTEDAQLFLRRAFEWDHGTVRLAGVLPDGTPALRSVPGRGAATEQPTLGGLTNTENAVSSDGSRIAFTEAMVGVEGRVFLRINARTTVQVNASELPSPDPAQMAQFWDMSRDGNRVFFSTAEALTDDVSDNLTRLYMWSRQAEDEQQSVVVSATGGTFTLTSRDMTTDPIPFDAGADAVESALAALRTVGAENVTVTGGPGDPGGGNPYVVTFTGDLAGVNVPQMTADATALSGGAGTASVATTIPVRNLTLLSADGPGVNPSDVQAGLGASDDGSYAYFLAIGQADLSRGIYLWHEGEVTYVGKVTFGDVESLVDGSRLNLQLKQLYVTPDGRHLLFNANSGEGLLSAHGGVDYDHRGCGAGGTSLCTQLYAYSADSDALTCVSCKAGGSPTASATMRVATANGGAQATNHMSRMLSDDGRYAFFSTADALVPEDVNGRVDAYEYDLQAGAPRLLSSGASTFDSYFLDSGSSGRDAFFVTREALVGWDTDQDYDLYDARVGGGFPEPAQHVPSCVGEACQGPLAVPPLAPTPGSSSVDGSGNERPTARRPARRPCGRGRVRRRVGGRVKCVKKPRSRRAARGRRTVSRRSAK